MKPPTSQIQPPGLYLVATPIGNLRDMTLRALDVLALVDVIACEDTRVTGVLLNHFGIKTPMLSYHDHNAAERRPEILALLAEGKRVALVSDAGTPLISDPGYKLVRAAYDAGHYVTAIPGASSILAGLCLSGLPTDRFFFAGFLPAKRDAAKKEIAALASIPGTLVFFEAARRLGSTLSWLLSELGDRPAAVARELTKRFEETRRGFLSELIRHYETSGEPKGEIVILVAPPDQVSVESADLVHAMRVLLADHSVKEAAAILAEQTGRPRKELYALALSLKTP